MTMFSDSYTTEQMGKAIIQDLQAFEVLMAQPEGFIEWRKEHDAGNYSDEPIPYFGVEYTDSFNDKHMIFFDPAQAASIMVGINSWLSGMLGEEIEL